MAAKKRKWYVVWEGREPGVYDIWEDCLDQVRGFNGARYRSFESQDDAVAAYRAGLTGDWKLVRSLVTSPRRAVNYEAIPEITLDSVAVDAACEGNPGRMEYRGVLVRTGQQIFHQGPFLEGTNNIGEFLAIVHALALLKQKGAAHITVYSDSATGISWARRGKCRTKLARNSVNAPLLDLVERAENWLKANAVTSPLLKWNTREWGEIPADFGRK